MTLLVVAIYKGGLIVVYVYLIFLILIWHNLRKLNKKFSDVLYETGKKRTNFGRFVDTICDVHEERVQRKQKKKESSFERTEENEHQESAETDGLPTE